MLSFVKEISDHKTALFTLVTVNLKTSVFSTRLGVVWWIADPIIMMSIYYFMVRIIFNRGGENYHLFALCGIVAWQFFSRALKSSSRSITSNKAMIQQIGLPVSVLIGVPVVVQMFFAIIGFCIVIVWSYSTLSITTIAIIPLLLLIALISYSLSIYLSMCEVIFRDTNQIVGYILRLGFFLTPILYPVTRVTESESIPAIIELVFQLNPFAWIIPSIRNVLLNQVMFDWCVYVVISSLTLAAIQIGLLLLRWQTPKLSKMI